MAELKILSLHVGGPVAVIERLVIDPNNLKVIAFELGGPLLRGRAEKILDASDVREVANVGIIIDSLDDLVETEDIIHVAKIMELNFGLVGLRVKTKKGVKLGKVVDFTLDTETLMVQQLIVQRPAMKALVDPELTIARSEIVEITDYEIIVKDEKKTAKAKEAVEFTSNFVNPFREPNFSTIHSRNPDESDTE